MWSILLSFFLYTAFIAPFAFIYFLMNTIRKAIKDENYDNSAMVTGLCLLWVMGSIAALSAVFLGLN